MSRCFGKIRVQTTRRGRLLGLAAAICLIACAGRQPAVETGPSIAGRYEALSESEWTLEVLLRPDGTGYVEYAWWEGDDDASRGTKRISARWNHSGEEVKLSYGEVTDTLRYHPKLSLRRAGRWGRRPGLTGVPPVHPQSVIGVSRLWSLGASNHAGR